MPRGFSDAVYSRAGRDRGRYPESDGHWRRRDYRSHGGHRGEGAGGGEVVEVSARGPAKPGQRAVRGPVGKRLSPNRQREHGGGGYD